MARKLAFNIMFKPHKAHILIRDIEPSKSAPRRIPRDNKLTFVWLLVSLFFIFSLSSLTIRAFYPSSSLIEGPETEPRIASGAFLYGGEVSAKPIFFGALLLESPESEAFLAPISAGLIKTDYLQSHSLLPSILKIESLESNNFSFEGAEVLKYTDDALSNYVLLSQIFIQSPESQPDSGIASIFFSMPNALPTALNLSSSEGDYCAALPYQRFSWEYQDDDGDPQKYYQLQVDRDGDWNTFIEGEFDTGKNLFSAADKLVSLDLNPQEGSEELAYNTLYDWRLTVWDDRGGESGWISASSFSTPLHIYPDPNFVWFPFLPSQGESVQFCAVQEGQEVCLLADDKSTCYSGSGAIPPPSCSGKNFLWTFPQGTTFATGISSTSSNPEVQFSTAGPQTVSLQITDDVGACAITKVVGINLSLPIEWRETAP